MIMEDQIQKTPANQQIDKSANQKADGSEVADTLANLSASQPAKVVNFKYRKKGGRLGFYSGNF